MTVTLTKRQLHASLFALILLVVLVAVESFVYYGARAIVSSVALLPATQGGMALEPPDALALYRRIVFATRLAPLLGGFLALLAGVRVGVVAGALLLPASLFLFGLYGADSPAALTAFALGHGLFLPTLYVLAARGVSAAGRGGRFAYFVLLLLAVDFGASVGQVVGASGAGTTAGAGFLRLGWVGLLLFALAVGAALADRAASPEAEPEEPSPGRRLVAIAVLTVPVVWFWFAYISGLEILAPVVSRWRAQGKAEVVNLYQLAQASLPFGTAALVAAVFFVLWLNRSRVPSAPVLVVVALFAAGGGYLLLEPMGSAGVWRALGWFAGGTALLGFAEALLMPLLAKVAGVFGSRLSCFFVGAYLVATSGLLFDDAAQRVGAELGGAISAACLRESFPGGRLLAAPRPAQPGAGAEGTRVTRGRHPERTSF